MPQVNMTDESWMATSDLDMLSDDTQEDQMTRDLSNELLTLDASHEYINCKRHTVEERKGKSRLSIHEASNAVLAAWG